MAEPLTAERVRALMDEIAAGAPRRGAHRVYLVGGTTAVHLGWRVSSLDADVCADDDVVFRDIQGIKRRLNLNIEFVRPEHFVPALKGTDERHVFVATIRGVSFFHYDPYAQVLAKLVRGFDRDVDDVRAFVRSGLVDPSRLLALVEAIPPAAYAKYPRLSPRAVLAAIRTFASGSHPA